MDAAAGIDDHGRLRLVSGVNLFDKPGQCVRVQVIEIQDQRIDFFQASGPINAVEEIARGNVEIGPKPRNNRQVVGPGGAVCPSVHCIDFGLIVAMIKGAVKIKGRYFSIKPP